MDLKTENLVGTASETKTNTNKQSRTPHDIVGKSKPVNFRVVSKTGFDWYQNNFKPSRREDVILCTLAKSGSTWLAVTCHLLRGGNLEFEGINQVVPWHQLGWDLDYDPASKVNTMQNKLWPRLWKSHQRISAEKPNTRYITTIRDPISVLKSWHHFYMTKKIPGFHGRSVDEVFADPKLFRDSMTEYPPPWEYLLESYLLRDHPDVLVVCYEDLQEDFTKMLPKIAYFLGIKKISQDLLCRITQMTSKDQMWKNIAKFNGKWSSRRHQEIGRSKILWEGTSEKISFVKYADPSEKTIKECGFLLEQKFRKHGLDMIKTYGDLRRAIKYSWKCRPAAQVSFLV